MSFSGLGPPGSQPGAFTNFATPPTPPGWPGLKDGNLSGRAAGRASHGRSQPAMTVVF